MRDLFDETSAALRLVTADLNAKQIGRLLRRAAGQAIGGYVIQDEGTEAHVHLWRVLEVPGFREAQNLTVPPRRDPPPRY